MIHEQLLKLKSYKSYPCVSILLPTSRTFPDFKKDEIVIKNLLKDAENRLLDKFHKREIQSILDKMENFQKEIDYKHLLDGMGIFISNETLEIVYMPFRVEKNVVIDESFQVRDIVHTLNRMYHYAAVVISDKKTKVYEGYNSSLSEMELEDFPVGIDDLANHDSSFGDPRARDKSSFDEKNRLKLVTFIDDALTKHVSQDLPLVIIGVDKQVGFFKKITKNESHILFYITGSYDYATPHELNKVIYPHLEEHIKKEKESLLGLLSEAVSRGTYTSGISQVWRKAHEGRIRTLIVEDNFSVGADLEEGGLSISLNSNKDRKPHIEDAVDDVAEMVILKGGNVRFVKEGSLDKHDRIASINRY